MKLQLKDQLTFQKNAGYPDDPYPVSIADVRETLKDWYCRIVKINEEGCPPENYEIELANLAMFLDNLANSCEIEYTEPMQEYIYDARFEYSKEFKIIARSQEEADKKAIEEFKYLSSYMPPKIGKNNTPDTCDLTYSYLKEGVNLGLVYEGVK